MILWLSSCRLLQGTNHVKDFDYIKAAGYSLWANDYKFHKSNKVNPWYTVAVVLPPGQVKLVVMEAIGDVLYRADMVLKSSGKGILARASGVYNNLADNVAEVVGLPRQTVDLNRLAEVKGDPNDHVPLTPSVASGSVA